MDANEEDVEIHETEVSNRFIALLKKYDAIILFLVIFQAGGFALDLRNTWNSDDGTLMPGHFSILVFHKTSGKLTRYFWPEPDLERLEKSAEYTYLIPDGAKSARTYKDGMSFSVKKLSDEEQIITHYYMYGRDDCCESSTYRATHNTIKPISARSEGAAYTWSFLAGLVLAFCYSIIKKLVLSFRLTTGTGKLVSRGFVVTFACVFVVLLATWSWLRLGSGDYIDTAHMTKVRSHYVEAIRLARETYRKGAIEGAEVPDNAENWIEIFETISRNAPRGGPAFVAGDIDGDERTGAIGVAASAASVTITMPAYDQLEAETTIVTSAPNGRID